MAEINHEDRPRLVILLGSTGVGKSKLAIELAEELGGEIISADSMQVYRYMDIGTAKPDRAEQGRVPHHLINIVDPDEHYTAARFVADARTAIAGITARGRIALLAGGTGLYLRSLLEGLFVMPRVAASLQERLRARLQEEGRGVLFAELEQIDPVTAGRLHPNDSQRLLRALEIYHATGIAWSEHLARQVRGGTGFQVLKLGLAADRPILYARINRRVEAMLGQGLVEEVRWLLARGYHGGLKAMQSIGYRHMVNFLEGRWEWDETLRLLARDTRRYAKRQLTWFQRDPEIEWFAQADRDGIAGCIKEFLAATPDRGLGGWKDQKSDKSCNCDWYDSL